MSVKENYNPISIETDILTKIKTLNVTANLYGGNRPAVSATTMSDFIVARVSTDMSDSTAYGTCITALELYAKDVNSVRNTAKLTTMRNVIAAQLPYISAKYNFTYFTETPTVSDGNGYTFQILKLFTLIK